MRPPVVALGVQGAQSATSAGRGLSRYVTEQAEALVKLRPGAVAQLSCSPRLALPETLSRLGALTSVAPSAQRPDGDGGLVYHVMSPFEFMNVDEIWPVWAQAADVALVVTLHDLIPLTYPDRYLTEAHGRRYYMTRLELVRGADAVVAISKSAAREAQTILGIPEERLFVSYEDCGPAFSPDPDRAAAFERARRALPALRPDFVVYVGGMDFRKNVVVLLEAISMLPAELRSRHQLVIAGRHPPHETRQLHAELDRFGIAAGTLVGGYLPDGVLADLYRSCAALVQPSLHEGFGLTALEAMRAGAPVLVSDATSLPEIVTWPEARFDPADAEALRDLLGRVLTDAAFRESLGRQGLQGARAFSWERSSEVVAEAHRYAAARRAGAA
ncbi:MAG TPA: glycosyltransferase family 1 protein [Candidatus Dormibacteraeota bacterium]